MHAPRTPHNLSLVLALALAVAAPAARAASVASDDASNYSSFGTFSASNLGTGFGAWTITGTDNNSSHEGTYLDTGSKAISQGTKAWGFYANNAQMVDAVRLFTGSLSIGQTFQVDLQYDGIGNGTGHTAPPGNGSARQAGFELRSGSTARWRFYFMGGASFCAFDDNAANNISIGVGGFPSGGFRVVFKLLSADTYEFAVISPNGGSLIYASGTRTLMGSAGSGVDRVDLYDNDNQDGSSGNCYFNSMKIGFDAPTISSQPAATTTTCQNTPAAFSVTGSSTDGSTVGYAWRKRGSGWGNSWTFTANGGNIFLASSPEIDTGGKAWGLQQTTGTLATEAMRALPATLAVNQTVSLDIDNKGISTGNSVGISLQDASGNNSFEFKFKGGDSNYNVRDNSSAARDTGFPYTSTGLNIKFTLTSSTAYSLTIRRLLDGATVTITGTPITGVSIQRIRFFDFQSGGGNNVYFNNLIVAGADDNAGNYSSWTGDKGQKPLANGASGNGSTYSGTATASFSILNAQTADGGNSYDCAVTSGQGYTTISSASALTVNGAPTFGAAQVNETCNGQSIGSITVTASGGSGSYTYSKDNGANFQAGNQFTSLAAGTYNVVVKDSLGCLSATNAVTITQPAAVTFGTSKTDNTACGGTAGSITVTASGGSGSYTYSKDNGTTFQAGNQFTGLASGSYNIVVKDSNGCLSATSVVTILDPTGPSLSLGQTAVTCNGGSDGTITATYSGGTAPYQIKIDAGSFATQSSPFTFTGLSAGSHGVTVKDNNGCTISQATSISQPTAVTFGTSQVNETCNGQSIGSITATASGGSGSGYTYSKNNGGTFQAGNQFTGLTAGTYNVLVKDSAGCLSSTSAVTITEPAAITFTTSSLPSGTVQNPYSQTIVATGGTGTLTYSTSSTLPTGLSLSSGGTLSGTPTQTGTFSVTVQATDANSCTGSQTYSLVINCPTITLAPATLPFALTNVSYSALSNTISASGGAAPYSFAVTSGSLPDGLSLNSSSGVISGTPTAAAFGASTFTVTATDASSCTGNRQYTVTVGGAPTVSDPAPVTACNGTTASFSVASGGSTPSSYAWRKRGSGWGAGNAWSFVFAGCNGTHGYYVGDSTACGGISPGVNSPGGSSALSLYANSGDNSEATRNFANLAIGQSVVLDYQNPRDMSSSGTGTIALYSLRDSSGAARFEFYFKGGDGDYTINDNNPLLNSSGIPYTAAGLHLVFTLVDADHYNLQVTRLSNGAVYTYVGRTLKGTVGNAISQLRFYYRNSGGGGTACQDFFFNNIIAGGYSDGAGNYSTGGCGTTSWTDGSNNGAAPLSDGGRISGTATATLQIASVQASDAGTYDVVAYNPYGAVRSNPTGTLTVDTTALAISGQPQSQTKHVGQPASFSVTATGCGSLSYQWLRNSAPLSGKTDSTLSLAAVGSCDAASYQVVVTAVNGSITSNPGVLTVINDPAAISPAGSLAIGTQNECGGIIFNSGNAYNWELSDASGAAGSGWDLLNIAGGGIDLEATAGNPFHLNLMSLNGGSAGQAANFDNNSSQSFTIASVSGDVTNFDASKFTIDTSAFANDLAGGVFSLASNNGLVLKFTNNHPPVAAAMSISRAPDVSTKIALSDVMTNWSDADGDATALVSVNSSSTNGNNNVSSHNGLIFYSPGAGGNVSDAITYTIKDLRAYRAGDTLRTAIGTILINVAQDTGQTQNILSITTLPDGNKRIVFAGIPNFTYLVQAIPSLDPPRVWTTLSTNTSASDGQWTYDDLDATNHTTRFYRSSTPQ